MSKLERTGAKLAAYVPNTIRLNDRLNEWVRLSGKGIKSLGGLHRKSWEKILKRETKYIRVDTLMNRIAPVLDVKPRVMSREIAVALEPHRNPVKTSATLEIHSDDPPPPQAAKLTWEMLSRLESDSMLREQLSDEDKELLLGCALDYFQLCTAGHENYWQSKNAYDAKQYTTLEDLVTAWFEQGRLKKHPLITGLDVLAMDYTQSSEGRARNFLDALQLIHHRLIAELPFKAAVSGLMFLLKRGATIPWTTPLRSDDDVESMLRYCNEMERIREEKARNLKKSE